MDPTLAPVSNLASVFATRQKEIRRRSLHASKGAFRTPFQRGIDHAQQFLNQFVLVNSNTYVYARLIRLALNPLALTQAARARELGPRVHSLKLA